MTISGTRRRAAAATVAGLAALTLVGCGSSSGSGSHGSNTSGATTPPSSGAPSGGGSADAATVAAVKNAYEKFFSPDTPEGVSLGLLQNGPKFKSTIDQQAQGSMAGGASVKVSTVSLVSANTAKVSFTIYVNKQPMLQNQPGYAIKDGGTWKVSEYTFCSLLTLEGSPPAECKTPTATETPR